MLSISIVEGDVLNRDSDLLILKYADGFHGVDRAVSELVGFEDHVETGDYALVVGRPSNAKQVLFIGVGVLYEFRYAEIRRFGHDALKLSAQLDDAPKKITMPIHGPGYGLDEREAFLSFVAGIMEAVEAGDLPRGLESLEIVELDPKRAVRLQHLLATVLKGQSPQVMKRGSLRVATKNGDRITPDGSSIPFIDLGKATDGLAKYGAPSERKIKLFVAMPFKDDYVDEYDIAISDAAQHVNIVCERIDKEAYVGDIMNNVKGRIASYNGMLALLNDANPNVFLEIGCAWAKEKPIVLMLRKDQSLPFDLSGQKCIMYSNISELRNKLKAELKALLDNGTLTSQSTG